MEADGKPREGCDFPLLHGFSSYAYNVALLGTAKLFFLCWKKQLCAVLACRMATRQVLSGQLHKPPLLSFNIR